MARAIIGKSKGEAALDKMIKFMDKSERNRQRNGHQPEKIPTLIEQLKTEYPTTWRLHLEEIKREDNIPGYLEEKRAMVEKVTADYWRMPRHDRANISEKTYITRATRSFIDNYSTK